jgi:hypothetical protein
VNPSDNVKIETLNSLGHRAHLSVADFDSVKGYHRSHLSAASAQKDLFGDVKFCPIDLTLMDRHFQFS